MGAGDAHGRGRRCIGRRCGGGWPLCRRGIRGGGGLRGGHFLRQSLSVQGTAWLGACMMSLDRHMRCCWWPTSFQASCSMVCRPELAACWMLFCLQVAVLGLSEAEFPQSLTLRVLMDTRFA